MLISLAPGLIVNTDTIATIKELPATGESRGRTEFTLTDGTMKTVNRPIDDFEWCTGPIIIAPPGYSVIRAFEPDKAADPWTFDTYPVIAFRLTDDEPVPVMPFGRLGETWALVWPDGRCDEQWNRIWPSVEAYKAAFGPRGERS